MSLDTVPSKLKKMMGCKSFNGLESNCKHVAKFWTCNQHVLEEVIRLLTAAAFCSRNLTPWCKRRGKHLDMV